MVPARWKPLIMLPAAYVVLVAVVVVCGARTRVAALGLPLAILSGWAFLGHLVTIDDEFPGGWSNPQRSRSVLLNSLGALVAKGTLFAAIAWAVLSRIL